MTTGFTQAFNIDINRFNMILRQHLFRELRCEFMYAGYFAAGCAVQVRMLVGVVEWLFFLCIRLNMSVAILRELKFPRAIIT